MITAGPDDPAGAPRGGRSAAADPVVELTVLGMPLQLTCQGAAADRLAAEVRRAWVRCRPLPVVDPGQSGIEPVRVTASLDRPEPGPLRDAMAQVATRITGAAIEACEPETLLLHAAGLADPQTGAGVVLVAGSGTGKSTLARTLGTELAYLSDETVGIAPDGRLLAYPRPVLVRDAPDDPGAPGADLLEKASLSPDELGLGAVGPPPWVAGVVLLDRSAEHEGPAVLEPIPVLEAIVALSPQVSHLSRTRAPLQRLVALLEATGGLTRLRYRDAPDARPVLHRLLRRPRVSLAPVAPLPGRWDRSAGSAGSAGSCRSGLGARLWSRVLDQVFDGDGESVVLVADEVLWLSSVASEMVALGRVGPTVAEATAALVARFGSPGPAPERAVRAMVEQLVGHGALRVEPA